MHKFNFLGLEHSIDESWRDLFNRLKDEISEINSLLSGTRAIKPAVSNVFNVFNTSIDDVNVVLLGQDPYPIGSDATGFAFELNGYNDWTITTKNTSLRNILKELYFCSTGTNANMTTIRKSITDSVFDILPPNDLFREWTSQGVFLFNTSLTCEENSPNSHKNIWSCFTRSIIIELAKRNKQTIWLLWGDEATSYRNLIEQFSTNEIIDNCHPAKNYFVGSGAFNKVIADYCIINNNA